MSWWPIYFAATASGVIVFLLVGIVAYRTGKSSDESLAAVIPWMLALGCGGAFVIGAIIRFFDLVL